MGRLSRLGAGPIPPRRAAPADPTPALIEAIAEPALVLDGFHIRHANQAARALLGQHIVGDYVRMALRHPAASAVLSGDEDGPVALTGLGGHDRLWELTAGTIQPGIRLLRLADRSAARAAERMRVDFVANASHELRTPLASLIGFIETLEEANGPAEAAIRTRFLGIMAGEARRMQRLIDDLMSLSRVEADRYARPRDRIDLAAIVRMACAELESGEPTPRIALSGGDEAITIEGDPGQISQLVHNVAGNALKYGLPGTPVSVKLMLLDRSVALSVTDRGEGVPAEHLPRLTERFYRVDAGRSRAVGGTGLGLAIVKHIVERHRGELAIDSVVGQGTTVTVSLPRA